MPYIKPQSRENLEHYPLDIWDSGELNYSLTKLIKAYLARKGTSYSTINDVVGALEGAKLEFYRRVVSPYEDEKIESNGDVYGND